jgi:hypothetical protein
MNPARKRTAYLGAVALVLTAVIIGFVRFHHAPPTFAVKPLAKNPPILRTSDVERLLSLNFRIVRTVQQVPTVVKQGFPSLAGDQPFAMVNPGQEMSTDDILPGVPDKRLVFAGLADDTAVVVFEQGGFVGTLHVAVLRYGNGGGVWGAMLEDYSVHDVAGLRSAVENNRFRTWESMRQQLE